MKAGTELKYLEIERSEWEHGKDIKAVANVVKLLRGGNSE